MDKFSNIVLIFFIYSMIGYVWEVILCLFMEKKLSNRGFLAGPYLPIYGCGALLVIFILRPFAQGSMLLLFVSAFFITSILEYFTSWLMEKLFDMRWWDYSEFKPNINGRVCLFGSLIFGVMSVGAMWGLQPFLMEKINGISDSTKYIIAGIFLAGFIVDIITTVHAVNKLKMKVKVIGETVSQLKEYNQKYSWFNIGDLKGSLDRLEEICKTSNDEELTALTKKLKFLENRSGSRLISAFPKLNHDYLNGGLSVIKRGMREKLFNRSKQK